MPSQPSAPAARPTYSPMIALIMAATSFMQNLDGAIINTSLPQMARSFGVSTIDLSMGITAYMLASAALSPLSAGCRKGSGSAGYCLSPSSPSRSHPYGAAWRRGWTCSCWPGSHRGWPGP
ncbi:hypothetical protein [Komagataeibacter kakiaceti]|uniref:hypothetical protein n=1 Tax=Komagataeibacter kakiaceti TaxID=943261 RepID=UPI000A4955C2|nr:hypothetical protein [Komagataeibacter kakiaceti]